MKTALMQFQAQSQGAGEDRKLELLSRGYDQALERINGLRKGFRELAMKVLSWMTCVKRSLTAAELQIAVAVEKYEAELEEDMISVCASLITFNK